MRLRMAYLLAQVAYMLMPARRRDWACAMAAELESLRGDPPAALRWSFGYIAAAVSAHGACAGFVEFVGMPLAIAIVIWLDWHAASDGPVLATLVSASLVLAFLDPERVRLIGGTLGSCLLVAHFVANFSDAYWPPYQYAPLAARDWLILAMVLLPAAAGSAAGRRLRETWTRHRRAI